MTSAGRLGAETGVARIAAAFSAARGRAALMPYLMGVFPDVETSVAVGAAYADAGADLIFTEALTGAADFEKFRAEVTTPLLANMTEFGKSELLTASQLTDIGYNVVIYPVTTLRLAMFAVEDGLREIDTTGTQSGLLDQMQHRKRLYELLRYADYSQFDADIFNFTVEGPNQ